MEPFRQVADLIAYACLFADFVVSVWEEGDTRPLAGNTLPNKSRLIPELRFDNLQSWSKLKIPCRVPPPPAMLCMGFTHQRLVGAACASAVWSKLGHECALRSGELLDLPYSDIQSGSSGRHGEVRFRDTATLRSTGTVENLYMRDPMTRMLVELLVLQLPSGSCESLAH